MSSTREEIIPPLKTKENILTAVIYIDILDIYIYLLLLLILHKNTRPTVNNGCAVEQLSRAYD